MRNAIAVMLLVAACGSSALGCSVKPGWKPPTPAAAFAAAPVVVHVRVLSQEGIDPSEVKVAVLRVLKGNFVGSTVRTASHSMCGVGKLEVGEEYVFFTDAQRYFVSHVSQPSGLSAAQVLKALEGRDRR